MESDARELARLWPNRTHESNWLKDVICGLGFHRWYSLQVSGPGKTAEYSFCRWCTKVNRNARHTES
jgi:hypothetical protein